MKAIIVTPAYQHVETATQKAVVASGLPWLPLYGHSDLVRARSVLISRGLEHDTERLILLDADVVPDDGVLAELAATDAVHPGQAVWGLYPKRDGEAWQVATDDPKAAIAAILRKESFPITWGGLGLCVIHRDSLVRAGESLPVVTEGAVSWRPFCLPYTRGRLYIPEDRSLCERLEMTGTRLVADGRYRAGHVASIILSEPKQR